MRTHADGITLSTSPSNCCTGCVSVLHRRDIEQIHIWRWCHEWWHTKTLKYALICCLNPLPKQMPSYYPCSRRERASTNCFSFDSIHNRTKLNKTKQNPKWATLLQRSVRQVMLQYHETFRCGASPQNARKHKVAASPRSAGCVRACVMKSIPASVFLSPDHVAS